MKTSELRDLAILEAWEAHEAILHQRSNKLPSATIRGRKEVWVKVAEMMGATDEDIPPEIPALIKPYQPEF